MLTAFRYGYYKTVARAVGVPDFWIEDAASEIAVTCWRRGNDHPGTVRSAAIDAVRRLGPRTRSGYERLVTVSLDHLSKRCGCFFSAGAAFERHHDGDHDAGEVEAHEPIVEAVRDLRAHRRHRPTVAA